MSDNTARNHPITVDVEGTSYQGSYRLHGRIVTVVYGSMECSRQAGGVSSEVLAMKLLREMVKTSQTEGNAAA